jgi:hypothetical protein
VALVVGVSLEDFVSPMIVLQLPRPIIISYEPETPEQEYPPNSAWKRISG